MNGYKYEHHAAKYLKKHGFSNIKVTKASGDYGADIIANKRGRRYAIQCKYYSRPVGLKAVQEVVAAKRYYHCSKAMVITNNTYTRQARVLAKTNSVQLVENIKPLFDRTDKNRKTADTIMFCLSMAMLIIAAVIITISICILQL